jgi:hypothetical protein
VWDPPGSPALRTLWPKYYSSVWFDAVIYVIDGAASAGWRRACLKKTHVCLQ